MTLETGCMSDQGGAAASRSWKRLDGIDLIRGLAILFVLMNHVNMQLLSRECHT